MPEPIDWQGARDLPFAAVRPPHAGGLTAGGDYDCVRFDQLSFDEPQAASSQFIESALTGVTFQGGRLPKARLRDVLMRDVRLIATGLGESHWTDVTVVESIAAGAEVFAAELRRVTFRGCKLDSVNFRGAALTEVTFAGCELRDVDFAGATLTRAAFPGSRLTRTDFINAAIGGGTIHGA